MIESIVNNFDLNNLMSDVFMMSLLGCVFLHLLFTKDKRLLNFSIVLLLIQFFNWNIRAFVWNHEQAIYIWYITWMVTDIVILLYVAYKAVATGKVTKEEFAVTIVTMIAILLYILRFVERHFTDLELIKSTQTFAVHSVNVCIVLALLTPIIKQLAVSLGRKLNGITIFGLRFSVSSVRSSAFLADPKGVSKQNRRTL